MKLCRYHTWVFRASLIFLVCILVFGVVFSLLPSGANVARSGVTLRGVTFSLYPEQDPGAVWRFQAGQVSVDPLKDENTLDELGKGERWLKGRDGTEKLDLTLTAKKLVIDANDNMKAQQARVYIFDGCYALNFQSSGTRPVLINQRSGISAPSVDISAPGVDAGMDDFSTSFNFKNTQGSQRPSPATGGFHTHADTVCKDGKVVPRT